ncbi:MAG: DUF5723 family protein [Flavobacteriaceae bacterium]|nr:DUF5723 family protein [Flavobacteriaceae bacterium]
MKHILLFLAVFVIFKGIAQNRPVLYDFTEIPQALMLNPGADVTYKWHVGLPALSGLSLAIGVKGFKITDLFAKDGIDINTKLQKLIYSRTPNDHLFINQQMALLNAGIRLPNEKDYISFGIYEEFNFIAYYPKDLILFGFEGNKQIDHVFNAESFKFKTDLVGVFHIGINRRLSDKLMVGARFKLYSSAGEIKSINNKGLFFTTKGVNNIYRHTLQNIDLSIHTAGFFNKTDYDENFYKYLFGKLFLGGNLGMGFDFGLTYKPNKQVKVTASIQDLGYIRYNKMVAGVTAKGNYTSEGIKLETPIVSGINYFQQIIDGVKEGIVRDTIFNSYTTFRSPKINASYAYSFGLPRLEECFKPIFDNPYRNQIGFQLYSVILPKQPQVAATVFYYRRVNKYFRAKLTYTVDSYTPSNVGLGFSSHIWHFNLYGSFNNLLSTDFYNSNYNAFQLGMNFIF